MEFPVRLVIMRQLLLCLLILLSMPAKADEEPWYNWLVGISAGYANRVGNLVVTNYYDVGLFDDAIQGSNIVRDLSDSGFIWGAFVGYQSICQKWLKGIELSIDDQSISTSKGLAFTDPSGVLGYSGLMRYQRNWVGGLSARFGYALTPRFMPYLRAGGELASDRLSTAFSSPGNFNNLAAANEERQWVYRFLLGAGIESPLWITCNSGSATIRLEYDYHSKGRTLITNATVYEGEFGAYFKAQSQPRTQSMRLAVVWNII